MSGPVQVQSGQAAGSGASLAVTLPNPVTAGNRIILIASATANGVSLSGAVATDSAGNTYALDCETTASAVLESGTIIRLIQFWSAQVTFAGACTITFTPTPAATDIQLQVQEWAGLYNGVNFPGGGGDPVQLGAAWIDHGVGEGAGAFPPLTLNFAADFPPLAAYYGDTLPLVGLVGAYGGVLTTAANIYPVAVNSLNVDFPLFPINNVAVGIIMLYVSAADVATVTCSITINANPCCANICAGLTPATKGVFYSATLAPTGGVPPYTFAIIGGALPTGLSLDPATGVISGIPAADGPFNFTVQVTDSVGNSATSGCVLTVGNSDCVDPTGGHGLETAEPQLSPVG